MYNFKGNNGSNMTVLTGMLPQEISLQALLSPWFSDYHQNSNLHIVIQEEEKKPRNFNCLSVFRGSRCSSTVNSLQIRYTQ